MAPTIEQLIHDLIKAAEDYGYTNDKEDLERKDRLHKDLLRRVLELEPVDPDDVLDM